MSYQNVIVIQDQFLLQHTAWDLEFTAKKEAREETSLVQLFEDKQLWEDIGYTVKEGVIRDGEFVTLYRTEETSPAFLEDHSSIDDLIQFRRF